MNQKSQLLLSTAQKHKLHQLQSDIETLEMQLDNILKEQARLNADRISPIYLRDRTANTGIKLAHDL